MRTGWIMSVVAALAVAAISVPADAEDLKKLGLDDASQLSLKIGTDTKVKTEGEGSVKISTPWPVTVCLAEFTDIDIEEARLVYKAQVKCDNLKGTAYLEIWCEVFGGQYFSMGMNSMVTGTMDWTTIETTFSLRKGQKPDKVTLNLVINGRGTIWIDNIVLSKEPLK